MLLSDLVNPHIILERHLPYVAPSYIYAPNLCICKTDRAQLYFVFKNNMKLNNSKFQSVTGRKDFIRYMILQKDDVDVEQQYLVLYLMICTFKISWIVENN